MDKNTQVSVHPSRNAKLVNYVGWTGHRNIGDEALYDVIQKVFSPYELVPTTNSLARARPQLCSGVTLFGGGTLLPRWAASVMPNRFNYAYGVGVVDPDFYRYQYGTHDMTVYDLAVQKTRKFNFRLLGVRGARSKKLLDSWGIKSFIVGDPCLLLRPSSLLKKREDLVAISVGSSEPYEPVWGKTEDVAREVSKLCSILTKKGYTLVLVPFSDVDMPHIQRVAEETGLPIFEGYENIQSLLDFVSTCHILVGQRLHSAVFSAAALTPFLSIKYHSKCGEFSESVGFQEYTLQANLLSAEKLSHSFEELNNNWDDMQAKLEKNVEACRERLLMFASNITEDIESLPETKWSPPQSWKRMRFQLVNAIELSAPRLSRLWNRAFA